MNSRSKLVKLVNFLIYLSPFFFPLYLIRFKVLSVPFTVLELYCYVLFAVYLLGLLSRQFRVSWVRPARYYYYLVFILLIGVTLGVVTAPHYIALPNGILMDAQQAALGVWKGWVVAPMLYFFVVTQTVCSPNDLKKLLIRFVYSGALVSLIAYGFGIFAEGVTYDMRLSGFYESANYLSLYLAPALLLGVYYLLNSDLLSPRQSLYNLMAVTVMTHALFMTQSYAAIIGVFGSLGLYILVILVKQRINLAKLLIGLFILLISFSAIIATQYDSPKFQQFIDFENRSSSSVRLEIYDIAYHLVSDYPLTGVGPGLFQGFYQTKGPGYLEHAPMEWNIPHPHNIFFAFWLNAGLLGIVAFLGLIVLAHTRLTYPLLAFWGILIHGLFDTPFWKNDLAMVFWLILAAILIIQTYGSSATPKRSGPIRKRATVRHSSSTKARKLNSKK
jgi:O-antigen ligase